MRIFLKKITLIAVFAVSGLCLFAQNKGVFQSKFLEAKNELNIGNYEKSFYLFKELTAKHDNNQFSPIAHYYCGLSAFKLAKYEDGRFILVTLMQVYPNWQGLDEARYLMANIAFEEQDLNKAFLYVNELQDTLLQKQSESMQYHYLQSYNNLGELKNLLKKYPERREIARQIAFILDERSNSFQDRFLLEYLIQEYDLKSGAFGPGTFRESVLKEQYNVAIMLPFMLNELKSTRSKKYFEMAEGIKLAVSKLEKEGVHINLFFYDTKKDSANVAAILGRPEMLSMDLLIGPVHHKPSEVAAKFARIHQINFVNPLYTNDVYVRHNDFTYLALASYVTQGTSLANYTINNAEPGEIAILYGDNMKDSIIAASYKQVLDTLDDYKVLTYERLNKENVSNIGKILSKANDTEDLRQVLVASHQVLDGAYTITALEQEDFSVPVLAPINWLDIKTNTFEQYRRRNVHLFTSTYVEIENKIVQKFRKQFQNVMGVKPLKNTHAYVGYDLMYFKGKQLNQYGNLYNNELKKKDYVAGLTLPGYSYVKDNNNAIIQVLHFDESYQLVWDNDPVKTKK